GGGAPGLAADRRPHRGPGPHLRVLPAPPGPVSRREAGRADMRVAVTLEQCWHRVPGGVARAAVESARAVAAAGLGIEQVGVSARHRHPAIGPWVPPIPVHPLPLPRRLLYETWHA